MKASLRCCDTNTRAVIAGHGRLLERILPILLDLLFLAKGTVDGSCPALLSWHINLWILRAGLDSIHVVQEREVDINCINPFQFLVELAV